MTGYNSETIVENGVKKFRIKFYTDNPEFYEMVKELCKQCVGLANQEVSKTRGRVETLDE